MKFAVIYYTAYTLCDRSGHLMPDVGQWMMAATLWVTDNWATLKRGGGVNVCSYSNRANSKKPHNLKHAHMLKADGTTLSIVQCALLLRIG